MTALALVPPAPLALPALAPAPMLAYLASLGSEDSRRTQASALHQVARWTGTAADGWAFPWATWDATKQAALRGYLTERHAPAYGNRILAAVRGVCKAAWQGRLMDGDTYARICAVPGCKGSRLPPGRALAPSELARLFEAASDATAAGARDTALLALLVGAGLRIHEPCGLQFADLDTERGRVRVLGKGNAERWGLLAPGMAARVALWLEVRGSAPGPLLWHVTPKDEPRPEALRVRGAARAIERLGERAGVELSTHDLRRTYASALLAQGTDLVTVQKIVGHSKSETTARYDRRPEERYAAEVARLVLLP